MARVLVIDDEAGIRDVLAALLVDEGHEVKTAENGALGVTIAERDNPDLIITDLVMPDQEGLETIGQLRKLNRNAKIIAISGFASGGRDYLRTAKALGATATVAKPIDYDAFLKLVGDLLATKT